MIYLLGFDSRKTNTRVHPASYSMGTGDFISLIIVAGTNLATCLNPVPRLVEVELHFYCHYTPSWCTKGHMCLHTFLLRITHTNYPFTFDGKYSRLCCYAYLLFRSSKTQTRQEKKFAHQIEGSIAIYNPNLFLEGTVVVTLYANNL
jgi:hypothetical protein